MQIEVSASEIKSAKKQTTGAALRWEASSRAKRSQWPSSKSKASK